MFLVAGIWERHFNWGTCLHHRRKLGYESSNCKQTAWGLKSLSCRGVKWGCGRNVADSRMAVEDTWTRGEKAHLKRADFYDAPHKYYTINEGAKCFLLRRNKRVTRFLFTPPKNDPTWFLWGRET